MKELKRIAVVLANIATVLLLVATVFILFNKEVYIARDVLLINNIIMFILLIAFVKTAKKNNNNKNSIVMICLFVATTYFTRNIASVINGLGGAATSGSYFTYVFTILIEALFVVCLILSAKGQKWASIVACVVFGLSAYNIYANLNECASVVINSLYAYIDIQDFDYFKTFLVNIGTLFAIVSVVLTYIAQALNVLTFNANENTEEETNEDVSE